MLVVLWYAFLFVHTSKSDISHLLNPHPSRCVAYSLSQDPSTLRLRWDSAPETVLVIKKQFDNSIVPHFKQLLHFLVAERKLTVFVEESVVEVQSTLFSM